jgi:serine/threonine protein kinase
MESLRSMNNTNIVPGVDEEEILNSMNNTEDVRSVAGRYKILRQIARGGMGAVYEGQDMDIFNRPVVVKSIETNLSEMYGPDANLKIFRQEAEVLATFEHPGLPVIYDHFTDDNVAYLVTEYVEGKNLQQVIEDAKDSFTEEQIVYLGIAIGEILSFLHNHTPKVIFRDLKPANVIIKPDGKVKLVDFGTSRAFSGEKRKTALRSGGNLNYAPPEMFDDHGILDERSDIYSLGAILHHLATGKDPGQLSLFSFPLIRTIRKDLSEPIEYIISRCTAREKVNRYKRVDRVVRDLKKIMMKMRACSRTGIQYSKSSPLSDFLAIAAYTATTVFEKITGAGFKPLKMTSNPEPLQTVPGDIDRITLNFSLPMDTASVKKALVVKYKRIEELKWSNEDTVCEIVLSFSLLPENFEGTLLRINGKIAQDKKGQNLIHKYNPQYRQNEDYLELVVKTEEISG